MKQIRTEDAVGHVLCHDITQIIPGTFKGPAFKKGHIVTPEDIPVLLSIGKENLYVWEKDENMLHEDEAADVLRSLAQGAHVLAGKPSEGKVELTAEIDGLFKVNSEGLFAINSTPQMMIATRHGNTPVRAGDKLAGTRIIPLVIEREKMEDLTARANEVTGGKPVLEVKPFVHKKVGIVTTGSEVYRGRIEDSFTPILLKKLKEFDVEVIGHELSDDNDRMTTDAIRKLLALGADVVLCTGGMSVDPDDRTPLAIKNAGPDIVTYGAPVLPGAMFLLSYLPWESGGSDTADGSDNADGSGNAGGSGNADSSDNTCGSDNAGGSGNADGSASRPPRVICGLPGCVMYAKRTIFDLLLPRIMADDPITQEQIQHLGEGGLCLGCKACTYPNCGFGK